MFTASIDDLAKAELFKNCNIITGFEEAEFGYFITLALTVDQAKNIDKTTFYSLLDNLRLPDNTIVDKNNVISAYFNGASFNNLNQTSLEYLDALIQIVSDLIFVCPNFELAEIYTSVDYFFVIIFHMIFFACIIHIIIYHACTFSFWVCLGILQIGTRHFMKWQVLHFDSKIYTNTGTLSNILI